MDILIRKAGLGPKLGFNDKDTSIECVDRWDSETSRKKGRVARLPIFPALDCVRGGVFN